jgi:hypothetical protein
LADQYDFEYYDLESEVRAAQKAITEVEGLKQVADEAA